MRISFEKRIVLSMLLLLFVIPASVYATSHLSQEADKFFERICSRSRLRSFLAYICDLRFRINEIEDQVDDLQERVEALEDQPEPQTLLEENFDGPVINTDIWEVFLNDSSFSFDSGFIVIPGGTSNPFIRAKSNPFTVSPPYTLEFGIQYLSIRPAGSGVSLSHALQPNIAPGWGNHPISFWADGGPNFLGFLSFGTSVWNKPGDTDYHIIKILYDGDKYFGYMDGDLKFTSPSLGAPGGLWFGHPVYPPATDWTSFKLDYIKVTQP